MKLCSLAIVAGLLLAAQAPAETVYVADPSMGMIFARRADSPTSYMMPFSGAVSVIADDVAHPEDKVVVYKPQNSNSIYRLNLETKSTERIYQIPQGWRFMDLNAGPGPEDVSLACEDTSGQLHLMEIGGSRNDYVFQSVQNLHTVNVLKVTDAEAPVYAVMVTESAKAEARLYYVNTSSSESLAPELFGRKQTLARTPNGGFITLAGEFFGNPDMLRKAYDSSGNETANSGWGPEARDTQGNAADVRQAPPAVSIVSQSAGYYRNFPWPGSLRVQEKAGYYNAPLVYVSRDELGKVKPRGDITGAATLKYQGPNKWLLYDYVGGNLRELDAEKRTVTDVVHFSAGDGPPFAEINDIAASPDGNLYVLDSARRIFRVGPNGDREIIWGVDDRRLQPFIDVQPDGTVALIEEVYLWNRLEPYFRERRIVLHIDVGGEEPLETKGEEVLPQAGVISMCAKGAREVWLQMPPISVNNYWIIGESGSRPLEGFSFKAQSLSFGPGTWPGYVRIAAHFALLGTQYTVDGARLVFTSKDYGYRKHITLSAEGCERTIASEELQYRDLGERVMRYSFFGLCGRMPASGRWTVNFEDEFYKAKETDWEFWLQPQFASKAYLMAIAPGAPEDPVVISRMPAELFLVDASETKVTRHPLMSISPESLDPQRLDSLSDMVYTPDGSAIMAASSIHPEVYRIDPSTGRTSLWVAGRGEGLDDESLGQPNTSHLRLAIGGDPVPSPRAGWVVISGK